MGTRLRFVQVYAADPSAVRAMVTNAEYITARAHVTGAFEVTQSTVTSADGVTVLEITRILPSEMPSFAAAIVGETLTVTEHQQWQPVDADRCSCEFSVEFSAPLAFLGTASMTFDGSQTEVLTEGEFKASIPLLGGKVERLALEQTERYLTKEQAFGTQWLQQGGQTL